MKRFFILISLISALSVFNSCQEVYPSDEFFADGSMATDYNFTYGLAHFYEYDKLNPGGIDIVDEFSFFEEYALKIYVVDGKLSFIEITTGSIPVDIYGFNLPEGKVPCVYDEVAVPHTLRLENGDILAYWQDGEFRFPFTLDSKKISYEITFKCTETTRKIK